LPHLLALIAVAVGAGAGAAGAAAARVFSRMPTLQMFQVPLPQLPRRRESHMLPPSTPLRQHLPPLSRIRLQMLRVRLQRAAGRVAAVGVAAVAAPLVMLLGMLRRLRRQQLPPL
jgi:hypothetical protein